jgi:hypothetical protein
VNVLLGGFSARAFLPWVPKNRLRLSWFRKRDWSPPVRIQIVVSIFAIVCFGVMTGCRNTENVSRKKTFPVTGTVNINKQPTAGARVTLYPLNLDDRNGDFWSQGFPHGISKDDGTFEINTYGKGDGAPTGDYLVLTVLMEGEGERAKDLLKSRYNDPKSAAQRTKVGEQSNTLTVDLKK